MGVDEYETNLWKPGRCGSWVNFASNKFGLRGAISGWIGWGGVWYRAVVKEWWIYIDTKGLEVTWHIVGIQ